MARGVEDVKSEQRTQKKMLLGLKKQISASKQCTCIDANATSKTSSNPLQLPCPLPVLTVEDFKLLNSFLSDSQSKSFFVGKIKVQRTECIQNLYFSDL